VNDALTQTFGYTHTPDFFTEVATSTGLSSTTATDAVLRILEKLLSKTKRISTSSALVITETVIALASNLTTLQASRAGKVIQQVTNRTAHIPQKLGNALMAAGSSLPGSTTHVIHVPQAPATGWYLIRAPCFSQGYASPVQ
jgi:hypothetical protein